MTLLLFQMILQPLRTSVPRNWKPTTLCILRLPQSKTPLVVDVIRTAYATDPSVIRKKAPDGLTPIHMAAGVQNMHALRTLLELGVGDDLQDAANKLGTTPLETVDSSMRSSRQLMDSILGVWNGYSVEDMTCQYLLKKTLGMPLVPPSESEYVEQRKLGCTCGTMHRRMAFPEDAVPVGRYAYLSLQLAFARSYTHVATK